jgi:hypothetical protein
MVDFLDFGLQHSKEGPHMPALGKRWSFPQQKLCAVNLVVNHHGKD